MYLISQLSVLCNVPVSTIRYYEKYGLLKGLVKSNKSNEYKYYNHEALEKLELIEEGKAIGMSLSEIKNLMKAWYSPRINNIQRIESLKHHYDLLQAKESKINDVKTRLNILICEMEKFV